MCALFESDVNTTSAPYLPSGDGSADATTEYNEFPGILNQRYREEDDRQVHRRRRWTQEEKRNIVAETEGPGASISGVARKYGIAPRLLFSWRRQFADEMTLTTRSGAKIVPISVVRDLEKRINELEETLEKKNSEISVLQKALESVGSH